MGAHCFTAYLLDITRDTPPLPRRWYVLYSENIDTHTHPYTPSRSPHPYPP